MNFIDYTQSENLKV